MGVVYKAEDTALHCFVKPPADTCVIGVTLYYMLTARCPSDFPSPLERIQGLLKGRRQQDPVLIILEDRPIPVRKRVTSFPKPLADVVYRAVRGSDVKRSATAVDIRQVLEATMEGLP